MMDTLDRAILFRKVKVFGRWMAAGYFVISALALVAGAKAIDYYHGHSQQLRAISAQEADNQVVGKFAISLMNLSRAQISDFHKQALAQSIVRVTQNVFSSLEERKAFVVLVAIESRFDKNAKSPVGAIGLSQIIPRYAEEFAARCGITGLSQSDLTDTETNMLVGACQFKELLTTFDGSVASALVAYNAGKSSVSLKEMQGLRNISNMETANYVSKFAYLKEMVEIKESAGDTK
jgi:hypothetical protein